MKASMVWLPWSCCLGRRPSETVTREELPMDTKDSSASQVERTARPPGRQLCHLHVTDSCEEKCFVASASNFHSLPLLLQQGYLQPRQMTGKLLPSPEGAISVSLNYFSVEAVCSFAKAIERDGVEVTSSSNSTEVNSVVDAVHVLELCRLNILFKEAWRVKVPAIRAAIKILGDEHCAPRGFTAEDKAAAIVAFRQLAREHRLLSEMDAPEATLLMNTIIRHLATNWSRYTSSGILAPRDGNDTEQPTLMSTMSEYSDICSLVFRHPALNAGY